MRSCLICDDHQLMRDALAMTVASRWPSARLSLAASFPAAWRQAEDQPDLCLVDLVMPGAGERDGVGRLAAILPASRIVVITGSQDDDLLLDLLATGIAGFIPKTSGPEIILAAIEMALAGGRYLPPRLLELADRRDARSARAQDRAVTARQRQILELVARGLSNKEIARELGISPFTVKTHVAQAMASVGGANRTDAAMQVVARRDQQSRPAQSFWAEGMKDQDET